MKRFSFAFVLWVGLMATSEKAVAETGAPGAVSATVVAAKAGMPATIAVQRILARQSADDDRDDSVRYARIVEGLGRLGPDALDPILEALARKPSATDASTASAVRAATVEAVGRLRDPRALPRLLKLVRSEEDARVRKSAVGALGRLGSESAISAALRAVRDEKQDQAGLVRALGSARDRRVAEELARLVVDAKDGDVAYAAAEALGSVASSWAWATPERAARGEYESVRLTAARALVRAYAVRPESDTAVRRAIVTSLAMAAPADAGRVVADARALVSDSGNAQLVKLDEALQRMRASSSRTP